MTGDEDGVPDLESDHGTDLKPAEMHKGRLDVFAACNDPPRVEIDGQVLLHLSASTKISGDALKASVEAPGEIRTMVVKRAGILMRAMISAPDHLHIKTVGTDGADKGGAGDLQEVGEGITVWRWRGTPSRAGRFQVEYTLHSLEKVAGKEIFQFVDHQVATVIVEVSAATRIARFMEQHWQWGFVTLVVPVWIRRRELWEKSKDLTKPLSKFRKRGVRN